MVAVVLFLANGLHGRVAKALGKVTVSVSDDGLAWIRRTGCSPELAQIWICCRFGLFLAVVVAVRARLTGGGRQVVLLLLVVLPSRRGGDLVLVGGVTQIWTRGCPDLLLPLGLLLPLLVVCAMECCWRGSGARLCGMEEVQGCCPGC